MPPIYLDDSALVRLVAQALLKLEIDTTSSPTAVYPPLVQQALDQVGMACLTHHLPVPGTVPRLVKWCATTPLSEWPLREPTGDARYLLDERTRPTRYCLDVAYSAGPTDKDPVREILADLRQRCGTDDRFQQCRRLLITSGVLDRDNTIGLMADPESSGHWDLIRRIYQGPDPSASSDLCAACGEGAVRPCKTPWCTSSDVVPAGQALVLPRELRHRVVQPGLGEVRIERRLHDLGIAVAPALGLFGGLTLPRLGWTVHVSSRTRSEFVAADLHRLAPDGHIFAVLPDDVVNDEFRGELRASMSGVDVEAVTEHDFLTAVSREHEGVPADA